MGFPDADMLGVDIVIPDFTWLEKNVDRIRGLVVTHGHEDHIGSIPYFLKKVGTDIPIYGGALTVGLIEGKLKEHGLLGRAKLNVIKPGDSVKLGCFSVEFIHVNHSIPDAMAVAITTPVGVIIQTGDFKVDYTPIDDTPIDIARFAEYGSKGVSSASWPTPPTPSGPASPKASRRWARPLRTCSRRPGTGGSSSPPSPPTSTGSSRSSIWRSRPGGRWPFPAGAW